MSELFPDEPVEQEIVEQTEQEPVEVKPEAVEAETETVEESTAPTAETQEDPIAELRRELEESKKALEQTNAQVSAFKTKALDEVRKRQALEQQERPDAYSNPDEAIDFSVNQLKSDFENRFLNMSEFNARSRHEDFDQMTELFFNEMVEKNPALHQSAMQHPDPYEYIYQTAKQHNEFRGISSIDDLKAKLRAEVEAELKAQQAEAQRQATEKAIADAIPNSLANKTAAGGNVTQGFAGPTPLNKILPN